MFEFPFFLQKYPTLVKDVKDYIALHGFGAQDKRRSEVGTIGVTIGQIRTHLQTIHDDLEVSLDTIRRLMVPPNKGNR